MTKKIAIYCDHWQNGGVENYIMNQVTNWDLSNLECVLVTAEKTTNKYDGMLAELGIKHMVLMGKVYSSPIKRILKTRKYCKLFFSKNQFDIAYFNLSNSVSMIFAKYAKKSGVGRIIVHSHCSQMQGALTKSLKQLGQSYAKRRFVKYATDWWACSDKAAEYLYSKKTLPYVVYIWNAIDMDKFKYDESVRSKIRANIKIDPSSKVIGTVGRCEQIKNQFFILDVVAALLNKNEKVSFLLAGDGTLRPELEAKARILGIKDSCFFIGEVKNVEEILCAMDIFVLPSYAEGYPVSVIEAQVSGLPCVLSQKITKQVKKIDTTVFERIDTEDSVERWENAILSLLNESLDRTHNIVGCENDIKMSAKIVQKMIMK